MSDGEKRPLTEEAHPAGIEPATDGLEIRCSSPLSYGCMAEACRMMHGFEARATRRPDFHPVGNGGVKEAAARSRSAESP
jgi:hypothetical protein